MYRKNFSEVCKGLFLKNCTSISHLQNHVTTQLALPSSQPSRPLYFGQGIEGDLHAQQIVMQSCIQQSIAHTVHDV